MRRSGAAGRLWGGLERHNGFTIEPRPGAQRFLDGWPRTPDNALDLDRAPVRLLAIVNRIDLRNLDEGNAGQGNFVFGLNIDGFRAQAVVMFEYKLPAATEADVLAWAQSFHALGALPRGSEAYNAALQALTERFVVRGARPGGVNGSALHAVRSNEFAFGGFFNEGFELREFTLSPATGRLVPSPLDRTPAERFNESFALSDFIVANREAILAGTHTIPDQFDGEPFRAGAIFNGSFTRWSPFDIDLPTRHAFAISTCNGCHFHETGAFFQHISNVNFDVLSPFLTGGTVHDFFTGETRTFNDMRRRRQDLEAIVCPLEPTVSLRRGISRVH